MLKKNVTYEMTVLFTPEVDINEMQIDKTILKALKDINIVLEDTGIAKELPDN